jgi:hypothetical protein
MSKGSAARRTQPKASAVSGERGIASSRLRASGDQLATPCAQTPISLDPRVGVRLALAERIQRLALILRIGAQVLGETQFQARVHFNNDEVQSEELDRKLSDTGKSLRSLASTLTDLGVEYDTTCNPRPGDSLTLSALTLTDTYLDRAAGAARGELDTTQW